uniref:ABC transporter ATP-binding protein n=1 Tax=candidate division WOR-3 bacterium TaxID=2052148 RepID=A0A7C3N7F5_UNCW3
MAKNKVTYFGKVFFYIKKEKIFFILGLMITILISISRLIDPLILAHIVDKTIPSGSTKDLLKFSLIFVIVILLSGFLTYIQNIIFAKLGLKLITRLKMDLFSHMLKLPVKFFDTKKVGELIARVESDGERVKQLFSNQMIMIFGNILFFVGMIVVLLMKNSFITLILLIPLSFVFVLSLLLIKYLTKFFKKVRELYAELSAQLTEFTQGMMVIQLFNREEKIKKTVENKSKEKFNVETKTSFIEYSFWSLQTFFVETLFIIIVILLVSPKIISGVLTLGTLVIFIQYGLRLFEPMMQIAENFNMFQRAFVSLQRIFNIMENDDESTSSGVKKIFGLERDIVFENVSFSYKEGEGVLKNLSFKIKKGEKVAFVGPSGSGKTTTANLLLGFYKDYKGKILIDGVELREYELKSLRELFSYIPQEGIIFPGDVLENVRLYDEKISEEVVKRSVKDVYGDSLLYNEFGIYREIKEKGRNISSGEKQLINLARVLVFSKASVVIMDEATSSIDEMTEQKIIDALDRILENKTSIIIAHRLSTVINCDKIFLFDDGRIIASGTHNQLIETSEEYRKIVSQHILKE